MDVKAILEKHGYRLKAVIADALGATKPTKFIITVGDLKVCPICQAAERDGVILIDEPYSNGRMAPSFHGKTCRCKQVTSGELSAALEVWASDKVLDVGIIEPTKAASASIREYGSGNSPPNTEVRQQMDNIPDEVFVPLDNDLSEYYAKKFMRR